MDRDGSDLFRSAAACYARFRPRYPAELFDHLIAHFALGPSTVVADVGCGTGQIAVPLAERGIPVVAIDPSPEMLAEAAAAAARAGVAERVRCVVGTGERLPELVSAPLRLLVAAQSFHWMDRDLVLAHGDRLVEAVGGVAVIAGAASAWDAQVEAWQQVLREVTQEFLGAERRAGAGVYVEPRERHQAVLARSPFRRVDEWRRPVALERTLDEVIGLHHSTSYATPALFGDRLAAFDAAARARLAARFPEGRFVERYDLVALCARRGAHVL